MGVKMGRVFGYWMPLFFVCGVLVKCRLFANDASKDKSNISDPVIEIYEETTLDAPEGVVEPSKGEFDGGKTEGIGDYLQDVADAASGKKAIDPTKVYTVRALLPVGELLMLSTASGCALLDDPSGVVDNTRSAGARVEPLEFTFKIADLEDCASLTDSIITGLKQQIAQEWDYIGKTPMGQDVKSETRESEINIRNPRIQNLHTDAINDYRDYAASRVDKSVSESPNMDLASDLLSANLRVNMIPTSSDGILVLHFYLSDQPSMAPAIDEEQIKAFSDALESISERIKQASPEELQQLQQEYKRKLSQVANQAQKQVEDAGSLLETLSNDDVASVECSSLPLDDCDSVAKCQLVHLSGKPTCLVSPKTIFWLMETGCALQSKPGLLSVARDLCKNSIIPEQNYHSLRQSFNTAHICNSIVHAYMDADIEEIKQHDKKPAFEF